LRSWLKAKVKINVKTNATATVTITLIYLLNNFYLISLDLPPATGVHIRLNGPSQLGIGWSISWQFNLRNTLMVLVK
jgi:hypothetical protein